MTTMNLTVDPWIPAVRANGTRGLFSLQGLFAEAHGLRDLVVKPHERIALMRLLICIAQAALDGPEDEGAWEVCEPLIQTRVRDYLEKWRGSFELFGDGPRFLQIKPGVLAPATPVMESEGITRLNLCMASGESNSILFDNSASDGRQFTPANAALSLLAYQCYSPLLGRGYKGRSPCADNNMLHTFLIGSTVLCTIRLNLLPLTGIEDSYSPYGIGQPFWEVVRSTEPSDDAKKMLTHSYLGRLVPLSRAIWLESTRTMTLANGLVYEGFLDSGYREASATIVATKKSQLSTLKVGPKRAIWRELSAVCVKNRQVDGVSGPLAFRNSIGDGDFTIWAGALVSEQAKIEDSLESTYSLPAGLFDDYGRVAYEQGIRQADDVEGLLRAAIRTYAENLKIGFPQYDRARQHFWTRVEQSLPALFDVARNRTSPDQLASSEWGQSVRAAARDAYEQACSRQTPRQIQAFALGLRRLHAAPKSNKPKAKSHE